MSLLSAGDEVAARGELLLGVDSRLLRCSNEGQLSGAPTVSGTSGRLWPPLQPAITGPSQAGRLNHHEGVHAWVGLLVLSPGSGLPDYWP